MSILNKIMAKVKKEAAQAFSLENIQNATNHLWKSLGLSVILKHRKRLSKGRRESWGKSY
jgi:hypothetical protein